MFAERHKNCKISLCNFLIMFVLLPFYNCATNTNKENCNRHSLVASVPEALVCWRRFALYQSYYGYRLTSSHISSLSFTNPIGRNWRKEGEPFWLDTHHYLFFDFFIIFIYIDDQYEPNDWAMSSKVKLHLNHHHNKNNNTVLSPLPALVGNNWGCIMERAGTGRRLKLL